MGGTEQPVLAAFDHSARRHRFGDRSLVVAFSGGADSLALLLAAKLRHRGPIWAAHLDHALDASSADRALAARRISERIGVAWYARRAEPIRCREAAHGTEAWARERRYDFLEQARQALDADWVLTAHHQDDQAETVLLRMEGGTSVWGLRSILPRNRRVVRPLLRLYRKDLLAFLRTAQPQADSPPNTWTVEDPSNRELRFRRNRIRHQVLPRLETADGQTKVPGEPGSSDHLRRALARLARRARTMSRSVLPRLEQELRVHHHPSSPNCWVADLPTRMHRSDVGAELLALALEALHQRAAAPPVRRAALQELLRQLKAGRQRPKVTAGQGWLWEIQLGEQRLLLRASDSCKQPKSPSFAYTFQIPGGLWLPEIGRTVEILRPEEVTTALPRRELLSILLPHAERRLVVRTRRPGDRRLDLIGKPPKKLKKTLSRLAIDSAERDALPLLALDDGRVVATLGLEHRVAARSLSRLPPSATSDTTVFRTWTVVQREAT